MCISVRFQILTLGSLFSPNMEKLGWLQFWFALKKLSYFTYAITNIIAIICVIITLKILPIPSKIPSWIWFLPNISSNDNNPFGCHSTQVARLTSEKFLHMYLVNCVAIIRYMCRHKLTTTGPDSIKAHSFVYSLDLIHNNNNHNETINAA